MNRTSNCNGLWRAGCALCCSLLWAGGSSAQDSDYDCLIEPSLTVEAGSSVRGVAESVRVDRGDVVKKGDVLVVLDSGVQRAAVELARARSNSTAEVTSREESLKLARQALQRVEQLFEAKNISRQMLDEATSEAVIAEANWHQAKDNRILAALDLKQAEEILALRSVASTINGVVVERMVSAGELVTEERPILRLAQIDPLHVEVIMPAAEFGSVAIGDKATVKPAAPLQGEYPARVIVIDRVIDAASGTFGVRLELPNPHHELPAGLNCRVDFRKR